jgi:hypothetical protein
VLIVWAGDKTTMVYSVTLCPRASRQTQSQRPAATQGIVSHNACPSGTAIICLAVLKGCIVIAPYIWGFGFFSVLFI